MSGAPETNRSYTVYSSVLEKSGKKLYLNAKTADVHFSFVTKNGAVKRVPAHKSVLAAASDVFEAMFYGDLREKGDVHLTDATESAFMEFLQFFYLDRAKLTIKNITGVMQLGNKYQVPECVAGCVEFLKKVLNVDNIFIGLNLAILYDHQELKKICETFTTLNTAEVLQSNGFMVCDREALAHILRMDVFSCSEVDVFKACMAWVRAKSKQNTLTKAMTKKYLDDLYYEIRFKSMTMPEFCELQMDEPVLRSDLSTIMNLIVRPEFQAENFCNDQRHAKWDAKSIIKCDLRVEKGNESSYNLWNEEVTTFSSNEPLLLGGFVCGKIQIKDGSNRRDLTSDLPVEVGVSEVSSSDETNAKVLLTMRTNLQSIDANHIQLPHPVLIRPKLQYKISIGPFPAQHEHFSGELKTVVWLSNHKWTRVEFHDCQTRPKDDKVIGLISCLNFNPL